MSLYWTSTKEILTPCTQERHFRQEILFGTHMLGRLVSGEVKVVVADKTYILKPGDTWFCPRNRLASFINISKDGTPYKAIVVSLEEERLKEFYTHNQPVIKSIHSGNISTFPSHPLLNGLFSSLMAYFDMEEELPIEIVKIKIDETITVLRKIDSSIDSCLANFSKSEKIDLADFMEKNFIFNVPLVKFAQFTGRSLTTFKTDFKKAFHISPQRWLTQKRLELAHYQIQEKQRKISEIYLEVGFENLSHFSFAFKKLFGYSPTELVEETLAQSEDMKQQLP